MGLSDFIKKLFTSNNTDTSYSNSSQDAWNNKYDDPYRNTVYSSGSFYFVVEDVFSITGRGTVVTGTVQKGEISVGQTVQLRKTDGTTMSVEVSGLESFRKLLDTASEGMNVGILLRGLSRTDVSRGDVLER